MKEESVSLRVEREAHDAAARVAPSDVLHVGRSPEADFIVENDPHVSARHFRLECRAGVWWVHDLESSNGTYVNGAKVRDASLHDGDRIRAGETTFRIWLDVGEPQAEERASVNFSGGGAGESESAFSPILNTTPFTVGTAYSEDGDGRARLSVVVKATWTIAQRPGVAATPLPIFVSDQYGSDDPSSALRFESDLAPFKPRADVVLVGHAYAPLGEPVTELVAGIRVGGLQCNVAVVGDRVWRWQSTSSPVIARPTPFTSMPLGYERAFGGIDGPAAMYCKENLVGTGFIGKRTRERIDGLPLPNLEDPKYPVSSCDTHPKPVGFGFYGRGWMPRLAYAGTYDEDYVTDRHPLPPVDFSQQFFNGAHPDLQVEGYLTGNEDVVLLNVCPETPEMRFRLPGVVPKVAVCRWEIPPEEWLEEHLGVDGSFPSELPLRHEVVNMVLDTLVFIPDDGVFYQVFRGGYRLSSLESPDVARIVVST